jgi:hypothetical protein
MSFKQASGMAMFNSADSCEFLSQYQDYLSNSLIKKEGLVKAPAFAPSSFSCERYSWFRLRGVETDGGEKLDPVLDFQAEVGTAIHRRFQRHLLAIFGDDYINPADYLAGKTNRFNFTSEKDPDSQETRIQIADPPMRLSTDVIIRWKGKIWLVEIKTCEFGAWNDLTDPRERDKDQIDCYSAVFDLPDVLVVYIDRQYGGIKVYQVNIPQYRRDEVWDTMSRVQKAVVTNLAPAKIVGGGWKCKECIYSKKCKAW